MTILHNAWLLGCAWLACSPALAQQGDWQTRAEQALQHALTERHPAVVEWRITALADARLEQRMAERTITRVEVAHAGKRSAVRLWCDEVAKRPCATVWFAVSGLQAVLTSQRELAQSHVVAAADFAVQSLDVMNLRCMPLVSLEGLPGQRTTRLLAAGEAVCQQFFESRPAVSRGETVEVLVAAGAVAITGRAIAQQDAALGQTVRIKPLHSAEPVLATVTAVGQVFIGELHE